MRDIHRTTERSTFNNGGETYEAPGDFGPALCWTDDIASVPLHTLESSDNLDESLISTMTGTVVSIATESDIPVTKVDTNYVLEYILRGSQSDTFYPSWNLGNFTSLISTFRSASIGFS